MSTVSRSIRARLAATLWLATVAGAAGAACVSEQNFTLQPGGTRSTSASIRR
jgi:hypothetical protein